MTKKERTGLQSKISHIFSGVPVPPKKSHPANGESVTAPKPGGSDVTQLPAEAQDVVEWNTEPQADIGSSVTQEAGTSGNLPPQASSDHAPEQITPAEQILILQDTESKTQDIEYSTPQSVAGAKVDSSLDIPRELPDTEPPAKTPVRAPAFIIERKTAPVTARKPTEITKVKTMTRQSKADAAQKRQRVQLAVLISLSILLVFILFNPFKVSTRAVTTNDNGQKVTTPAAGTDNAIAKIIWPTPPDYPSDIPDPMDATAIRQVEPQSLRPIVTGITYSNDRPQVIIGTQLVSEGEQINGFIVLKIYPEEVIFKKDDKEIVVKKNKDSGKFEIEQ